MGQEQGDGRPVTAAAGLSLPPVSVSAAALSGPQSAAVGTVREQGLGLSSILNPSQSLLFILGNLGNPPKLSFFLIFICKIRIPKIFDF